MKVNMIPYLPVSKLLFVLLILNGLVLASYWADPSPILSDDLNLVDGVLYYSSGNTFGVADPDTGKVNFTRLVEGEITSNLLFLNDDIVFATDQNKVAFFNLDTKNVSYVQIVSDYDLGTIFQLHVSNDENGLVGVTSNTLVFKIVDQSIMWSAKPLCTDYKQGTSGITTGLDRIYGTCGNELVGLNSIDGSVDWQVQMDAISNVQPIFYNDKVYVMNINGKLDRYTSTGLSNKNLFLEDKAIGNIMIQNGLLYVITSSGKIYAVDPIYLTIEWESQTTSPLKFTYSNNQIIVNHDNNIISGYDPANGELLWLLTVDDQPIDTVLYGDKIIYSMLYSTKISYIDTTCSFTYPLSGSTFSNAEILIYGTAHSDSLINSVELWVDNQWITVEGTNNWIYYLDPSEARDGHILVKCKVNDGTNRYGDSDEYPSIDLYKVSSLKTQTIYPKYPSSINIGQPFKFEVYNKYGHSVNDFVVFVENDVYEGVNGSVMITLYKSKNLVRVEAPGYYSWDIHLEAKDDSMNILLMSLGVVMVVVAIYLYLNKDKIKGKTK